MIFNVEGAYVVTRDQNASFTRLNKGEIFLYVERHQWSPIPLYKIYECKSFSMCDVIVDGGKVNLHFNALFCYRILEIESSLPDAIKSCLYHNVTPEFKVD